MNEIIKIMDKTKALLDKVNNITLRFHSFDKGQLFFEGKKGKYEIFAGISYSNLQKCSYIGNKATLGEYYKGFDILIIKKDGEKVYEKYM